MLFNIVLASAICQHESAIGIHMTPPPWTSLTPPTPFHPTGLSQSTGFELPESYNKFLLIIYFAYGNIYVSMLLSLSYVSFPHRVYKSILCVCWVVFTTFDPYVYQAWWQKNLVF